MTQNLTKSHKPFGWHIKSGPNHSRHSLDLITAAHFVVVTTKCMFSGRVGGGGVYGGVSN
jgi:hypothetical protein